MSIEKDKQELTPAQLLQQESALEYMNFVKGMFKKANAENALKERIETLLLDYLSDPDNVQNLTFGAMLSAYREVNKSDNELTIGLATAISKAKGNDGNPQFGPPDASGSPQTKDIGPDGSKPSPEKIAQAKRVLKMIDDIEKLGEAEK